MKKMELEKTKKELKKSFVVDGFRVKVNEVGNLLINGKEVNLKEYEKMIYDLISEGLSVIVEKK